MRLGLIGTGKQGQRYLLEKNGGRHITVSGSRRIPLDEVDGVIIATHPAGHKELALECIAAGKAVLIEKPLALNLADCEEILEAAEKAKVAMDVAHTHLWAPSWTPRKWQKNYVADATAVAVYVEHDRDYSAWLDWGPHVLALVADACPRFGTEDLLINAKVEHHRTMRGVFCNVRRRGKLESSYSSTEPSSGPTPMFRMVERFIKLHTESRGAVAYQAARRHFNRRVYRALFAE